MCLLKVNPSPGDLEPILPYLPCLTCSLLYLYSFLLPCRITLTNETQFFKKYSLLHSSLRQQSPLKESSVSPLPTPSSILHNLASVPPTPLTWRPPCCKIQWPDGPCPHGPLCCVCQGDHSPRHLCSLNPHGLTLSYLRFPFVSFTGHFSPAPPTPISAGIFL